MPISPKTGIIPFSYFNHRSSGSTFLRAEGIVNTTTDFEIWKHGRKYDNLIFEKVYWTDMMDHFKGPKILDLCDPDWIKGTVDLIEIGNKIDAITCSSASLTALVQAYLPHKMVVHVPDRLNFNLFPPPRELHQGQAKNVVWFGYISNAHATLAQLASILKKHHLNLTIIADAPYTNEDEIQEMQYKFIPYNQQSVYSLIQQADIVLNPKSNKAFYRYKSNNKSVIAWKLGLPVAETQEQLEWFLTAENRNAEVTIRRDVVDSQYNILQSAAQYREIFEKIRNINYTFSNF